MLFFEKRGSSVLFIYGIITNKKAAI